MLRALAVLRLVVLLNAVAIYLFRYPGYDHPLAGALVIVLMVGWTGFVVWAYGAAQRRRPVLLVADLLVAVAAIAVSPSQGRGADTPCPASG